MYYGVSITIKPHSMVGSFLSAEELARARELGEGVEWVLARADGQITALQTQLREVHAERDADRVNSGASGGRRPDARRSRHRSPAPRARRATAE